MSRLDDVINTIYAAREGGHTERCHTLPHHGSYSVGKHQYDALSLLLILHPNPSGHLIRAVLWHDVAERWVGDMPAPAKWFNPALRQELEVAEGHVDDKLGLINWGALSDDDRQWLDEVDRLEVMLWALDQEGMGNRNAAHFAKVIIDYFNDKPGVHHEVMEVVLNVRWRRLPDRM